MTYRSYCIAFLLLSSCVVSPAPGQTTNAPTGGEVMLRQAWLRRSTASGETATIRFTMTAGVPARGPEAQAERRGVRWHPGGANWPILSTTHPLQFGLDATGPDVARMRIPAGRYVATLQGSRAASLILTRASRVVGKFDPEAPERLLGLGGYVIPLESWDDDHVAAQPTFRLKASTLQGAEGEFGLQVGKFSWSLDFTVLPQEAAKVEASIGVDGHLARLGVAAPVRMALQREARSMVVFSVDPASVENGARPAKNRFRGYEVIDQRQLVGTRPLDRSAMNRLRTLLTESVLFNPKQTTAECFEPRHALRIETDRGVAELLICFECWKAHVWIAGKRVEGISLTGLWEPQFTATLVGLGMKVAVNPGRNHVLDERRRPIAGAMVWIHTVRDGILGGLLRRDPHLWKRTSDAAGRYDPKASYRRRAIYAVADGFYPASSDGSGNHVLQRVPKGALPVRRGAVVVRRDGTVKGFDFASGREVPAKDADIAPVAGNVEDPYPQIRARGKGGFCRVPVATQLNRPDIMVAFFSDHRVTDQEFVPGVGGGHAARWTKTPYIVRCRDGKHYAKIVAIYSVLDAKGIEQRFEFDYVYQPKVGGHLGPEWTAQMLETLLPRGKRH